MSFPWPRTKQPAVAPSPARCFGSDTSGDEPDRTRPPAAQRRRAERRVHRRPGRRGCGQRGRAHRCRGGRPAHPRCRRLAPARPVRPDHDHRLRPGAGERRRAARRPDHHGSARKLADPVRGRGPGYGIPVPLEDGLVWAALRQDAIVVQLSDRSGPLAGQTRVPARVFTGSMARPWAASWMTPAMHHLGGHHVSPHPRTAGGLP